MFIPPMIKIVFTIVKLFSLKSGEYHEHENWQEFEGDMGAGLGGVGAHQEGAGAHQEEARAQHEGRGGTDPPDKTWFCYQCPFKARHVKNQKSENQSKPNLNWYKNRT